MSASDANPLLAIKIGQPQRFMFASLNYASHESFVIDVQCGQKQFDCPRYCKNSVFRQIYCHPLCFQMNQAEQSLNCGYSTSHRYFSNASKTLKNTEEAWKGQYVGTRQLWGKYAKEDVVFQHFVEDDYAPKFELKQMRFVRGMSMDVRFMSGYFKVGVGPVPSSEQNNFVTYLYKENQIDKPILTFWNSYKKDAYMDQQMMFTIGAIERRYCQKWIRRRNLSKTGWVVEVDLEVGGMVFRKTRISFYSKNGQTVSVPQPQIDILIKRHQLQKYNDTTNHRYYKYYSKGRNMTLSIFGPNFKLTSQDVMQIGYYNDVQQSSLKMNDLDEYKDQPAWIFGYSFFQSYCVYFDYERNEMGIGQIVLNPK